MKVQPYLVFNGNAEEALNFYTNVFNGTAGGILRYGDCRDSYGDLETLAGYEEKLVLSDLHFNGCTIGLADTLPSIKAGFGSGGHAIKIVCDTEQQLKEIYEKLPVGGQIQCELFTPGFAKLYTEITDKFGVQWALLYGEEV